jgi:hypothetical protein
VVNAVPFIWQVTQTAAALRRDEWRLLANRGVSLRRNSQAANGGIAGFASPSNSLLMLTAEPFCGLLARLCVPCGRLCVPSGRLAKIA